MPVGGPPPNRAYRSSLENSVGRSRYEGRLKEAILVRLQKDALDKAQALAWARNWLALATSAPRHAPRRFQLQFGAEIAVNR